MYELIIIGAGPAGISMAAEARSVSLPSEHIRVLEKRPTHSWAIRKFYPAKKTVLANYKGIEAVCKGVLCISDMSKDETLTYIDRAIEHAERDILVSRGMPDPDGELPLSAATLFEGLNEAQSVRPI